MILSRAVGELSIGVEGVPAWDIGAYGSEDADMSSDKGGEKPPRRKPKVSWVKKIFPGLAGPKPRPKGVGDG